MSKSSNAVKNWRKNTKLKIVKSMGGCCQICGYFKCPESLDLHHLDPLEKELSIGQVIANPKAWETKIVPELKKCILLCSNCHREYHAGYVTIPTDFCKYDENLILNFKLSEMFDSCKCGNQKPIINNYCSVSCSANYTGNLDQSLNLNNDLIIKMFENKYTNFQVANYFNCSIATIKRYKKLLGLSKSQCSKGG